MAEYIYLHTLIYIHILYLYTTKVHRKYSEPSRHWRCWLKMLTALHEHLAAQIIQLLKDGTQSEWFAPRSNIPNHERPPEGTSNSQPITCLCTTWKVLSGNIAAKRSRHVFQYMSHT